MDSKACIFFSPVEKAVTDAGGVVVGVQEAVSPRREQSFWTFAMRIIRALHLQS